MANEYCSDQDLYQYGLPRGTLANPGRDVASIDTTTGVYTLDAHGFGGATERTPVTFRAAHGGTIQQGVTEGTTYYAEALTDRTFQVYAASTGGSPIVSTDGGENVVVVGPIPDMREFYSRWCDTFFPGHVVPFEDPIPPLVRGLTAQLCANATLRATGQASVSQDEIENQARVQLERFAKGMAIRGDSSVKRANLAYATHATTRWTSETGRIP